MSDDLIFAGLAIFIVVMIVTLVILIFHDWIINGDESGKDK